MLCLDFFGEVGANLREVGEPVEVDSGLDITRDLEILALVERHRAARRTCHGRQIAACTAADNANARRVDAEAVGIRLEVADGRLDILERLREFRRRCDAVVDAADDIAVLRQVHAELDAIVLVGVDEAASRDKEDGGLLFLRLRLQDVHLHRHIRITAARHLLVDDVRDQSDFCFVRLDIEDFARHMAPHVLRRRIHMHLRLRWCRHGRLPHEHHAAGHHRHHQQFSNFLVALHRNPSDSIIRYGTIIA